MAHTVCVCVCVSKERDCLIEDNRISFSNSGENLPMFILAIVFLVSESLGGQKALNTKMLSTAPHRKWSFGWLSFRLGKAREVRPPTGQNAHHLVMWRACVLWIHCKSPGSVVGTLPRPSSGLSLFLTSVGQVFSLHSPFLQTEPLIRCPHFTHTTQRSHRSPWSLQVCLLSFSLSPSSASHNLWAWISFKPF